MGFAIVAGGNPNMAVPTSGIALGDIAEGQLVKIKENGSPVEFYVAKHNYEPTLNGTGRTLLVRKDAYSSVVWGISGNYNAYAKSNIDAVANGSYKEKLDQDTLSAIGATKFYYTVGNGNSAVTTLLRAIFTLSATELGGSGGNTEGAVLPTASILKTLSPSQATRSPVPTNRTMFYAYYYTGGLKTADVYQYPFPLRPCFTLPSTSTFDKNMVFKGG